MAQHQARLVRRNRHNGWHGFRAKESQNRRYFVCIAQISSSIIGCSPYFSKIRVDSTCFFWYNAIIGGDLMPMTAKEAIRRLKREGWVEVRQTGSHKQFVRDGNRITIPDHRGDLKPKVERDVKKKAGW